MIRTLTVVALAALAAQPLAAAAEFVELASSDEFAVAVNLDSIARHDKAVHAVIRQTLKNARSISLKRVVVREADCGPGQGKLVMSDLDGKNRLRLDWAEGGGNFTAAVGELLCNWVRLEKVLLS
jgi:hypothetical protein